jgi:hypothetical protein
VDTRLSAGLLGGVLGIVLVVLLALLRPPSAPSDPFLRPAEGGAVASASFPPLMETSDVYRAFTELGTVSSSGEAAPLSVLEAGELVLPTGRVTASDVYLFDQPPFTRTVPPGRYPVLLLRAEYADGDAVAAAMLRVGPGEPVGWEPATIGGVDPADVDQDTFASYGVDSGTAAFAGAEAAERLYAGDEALWEAYGDEVTRGLFPGEIEHRLSAEVFVDPASGANVIAFSSGFGDGGYPAWFGLDADGEPLVLLTDFGILEAPPR